MDDRHKYIASKYKNFRGKQRENLCEFDLCKGFLAIAPKEYIFPKGEN